MDHNALSFMSEFYGGIYRPIDTTSIKYGKIYMLCHLFSNCVIQID